MTRDPITLPWRLILVTLCSLVCAGVLLGAESEESSTPASPSLDELLLFQPTRYPRGEWEPQNLTYEDVWFEAADGVKLHGWYCPSDDPVAVVLYVHGTGGNLSDRRFLIKSLQTELRLSLFIFDYRGYGRSEGVPSVTGALQDATAARRELARLAEVNTHDVVLMGRSLGGAIAIQLAADLAPRGLVVESSFSSLKDMANLHFPNLAWVVPVDKLNSVATVKRYRGPYLQSHGDADTLIPFNSGKRLFQAANRPKRLIRIPHANHNDPQSRAYYQALKRFLHRLRPGHDLCANMMRQCYVGVIDGGDGEGARRMRGCMLSGHEMSYDTSSQRPDGGYGPRDVSKMLTRNNFQLTDLTERTISRASRNAASLIFIGPQTRRKCRIDIRTCVPARVPSGRMATRTRHSRSSQLKEPTDMATSTTRKRTAKKSTTKRSTTRKTATKSAKSRTGTAKKSTAKKTTASKTAKTSTKRATATKSTKKRAGTAAKKTTAKRTTAKKSTKRATASKSAKTRTGAAKKSTARKSTTSRTTKKTTKRATASKSAKSRTGASRSTAKRTASKRK